MRTDEVYNLGPENGRRVRGGPDWVRSELYTIEAVAGGPADAQTMRGPMLRALLERRFGLKVHIETEEMPAFELTVAPGGHKMKEGTCTLSKTPPVGGAPENKGLMVGDVAGLLLKARDAIRRGETPTDICGRLGGLANGPNKLLVGVMVNVQPLGGMVDAPIINRTGIPAAARFNYVLEYLPDDSLSRGGQLLGGIQIASDRSAVASRARVLHCPRRTTGTEACAGARAARVRRHRSGRTAVSELAIAETRNQCAPCDV